jgi:hypothetical protein
MNEARAGLLVSAEMLRKEFYGDMAVESLVPGFVHNPHSPLTEFFDDLIM